MGSIHGWLDDVKQGFGDRFVAAFEELGVEDTDDLRDVGADELQTLEAGLQGLGAQELQLKKIRRAILACTTCEVDTSSAAPAPPESREYAEQFGLSAPKSQPHTSAEEALQDASQQPWPDWWLPQEVDNNLEPSTPIPVTQALAQLLRTACRQGCVVELPDGACEFVSTARDKAQATQFVWVYRMDKPLQKHTKLFREHGLELQRACTMIVEEISKLGGSYRMERPCGGPLQVYRRTSKWYKLQ